MDVLWEKNQLYLFTQFSLGLLDSRTKCHKVTAFKDITLEIMYSNNNEHAA